MNEFLTNDTIKINELNSKVIDDRCHIILVLKGQLSSNHDSAPQDDPQVVEMRKYALLIEENHHHL